MSDSFTGIKASTVVYVLRHITTRDGTITGFTINHVKIELSLKPGLIIAILKTRSKSLAASVSLMQEQHAMLVFAQDGLKAE